MRTAIVAGIICLGSWAALLVGAGNVGLQRSVSMGPWTLVEFPLALLLAALLAFGAALAQRDGPARLVALILLGDVIGAIVVAPLAVGELTPINAPVVFVVLAALGLQPLAAALGAVAESRRVLKSGTTS